MTPVELLKSLSGPAALSGAPFGADLIAMCTALEARGGAGVYVARDDKTAATARRIAQFAAPCLEQVDLPSWDTLSYDRVSPTAGVAARRCAALARLSRYEPEQVRSSSSPQRRLWSNGFHPSACCDGLPSR